MLSNLLATVSNSEYPSPVSNYSKRESQGSWLMFRRCFWWLTVYRSFTKTAILLLAKPPLPKLSPQSVDVKLLVSAVKCLEGMELFSIIMRWKHMPTWKHSTHTRVLMTLIPWLLQESSQELLLLKFPRKTEEPVAFGMAFSLILLPLYVF